MKPADLLDQPGLNLAPVLRTAFAKTLESWRPPLRHLPVPVRFRASGALRAWLAAFDTLPSTDGARRALADPATAPQAARFELMMALEPHITVSARESTRLVPLVRTLLRASSDMLAFWLRSGAIYEPTLPLGGLLGGIDMSQDLPLQLLRPATPALCIVPPWQQRHHCTDADAVMVFAHDATRVQAPAARTLTMLALRPNADGFTADELTLPVKDENATLAEALARPAEATRRQPAAAGLEGEDIDTLVTDWKQVLDYAVKVLLYLNLDDASLRQAQALHPRPQRVPRPGAAQARSEVGRGRATLRPLHRRPRQRGGMGGRARGATGRARATVGALAARAFQASGPWAEGRAAQGHVHHADHRAGGSAGRDRRSASGRGLIHGGNSRRFGRTTPHRKKIGFELTTPMSFSPTRSTPASAFASRRETCSFAA